MRQRTPFLLSRLAESSGGRLDGVDVEISNAAGLEDAGPEALAFVRSTVSVEAALASSAGALIIPEDFPAVDRPALRHENPRFAFAVALGMLSPAEQPEPGIHASAVVDSTARVGRNCSIGPNAVIEEQVEIGDGTVIGPGVVVERRSTIGKNCRLDANAVVYRDCRLGNEVTLFAGAIIGGDGFGFEPHRGAIHRLPHIGNTVLEDGVEIGANTCVDRGTTGTTRIGAHSKLDNLVMIAHNCRIGSHTMIAGHAGMAGSAKLGNGVIIGGGTRIRDHVVVGDGVTVAGNSGVARNLKSGERVSGMPAHRHQDNLKELLATQRLPQLLKDFRKLQREVEDLRRQLDEKDS